MRFSDGLPFNLVLPLLVVLGSSVILAGSAIVTSIVVGRRYSRPTSYLAGLMVMLVCLVTMIAPLQLWFWRWFLAF